MGVLKLDQFDGLYPRAPAHLLPASAAVRSEWNDHLHGELRPIEPTLTAQTEVAYDYVHRVYAPNGMGGADFFYTWNANQASCDIQRPPTGALDQQAFYYTSYAAIKARQTDFVHGGQPGEKYRLGVPQGPNSFSINVVGGTTGTGLQTFAYVITLVNAQGEEGAPSNPVTVSWTPGVSAVSINVTSPYPWPDPVGGVSFQIPTKFRVYRTQAGGAIDEYYFSVEGTLAPSGGYTTVTDAALVNEPLSSYDYYPAPYPLAGLTTSPSGALVAWNGHDVYFSVEKKPWAWPPLYKLTLPSTVWQIVPHDSGLLAFTPERVYFIAGVPFESLPTPLALPFQYGLASPEALTPIPGGWAFASPAGIVMLNGISANLELSLKLFTSEMWFNRYVKPSVNLQLAYHADMLLVFDGVNATFSTPGFTPFLLRLGPGAPAMTELPGLVLSGASVESVFMGQRQLYGYLAHQSNGAGGYVTRLVQFGALAAGRTMAWRSREAVMAQPAAFAVAAVRCTGAFDIAIYADGVLRHTEHVSGDDTFRLPAGFKARHWQVEITGNGTFKSLCLAGSPRELQGV